MAKARARKAKPVEEPRFVMEPTGYMQRILASLDLNLEKDSAAIVRELRHKSEEYENIANRIEAAREKENWNEVYWGISGWGSYGPKLDNLVELFWNLSKDIKSRKQLRYALGLDVLIDDNDWY